jgi:hypothetical protein
MFITRCRLRLKCDGTRAETRFRLSAKRTIPFKSAGRQFSRLLAAEVRASAVVMLDTPCSEVVLATHSVRQFPLHFPSRASPCAITFPLDSTYSCKQQGLGFVSHFQSFHQPDPRTAWVSIEWGEGLGSAGGTCDVSQSSGLVLGLGVTGENPSFVSM